MKYLIALAILVLSATAVAEDPKNCVPGTGMHFNGGEMVCDQRLPSETLYGTPIPPAPVVAIPDCSPSTKPGTVCTWPSSVRVISQQYVGGGNPNYQFDGKLVAIIDGTPLIPMPAGFTRQTLHLVYDDCWLDLKVRTTESICFTYNRYLDPWSGL